MSGASSSSLVSATRRFSPPESVLDIGVAIGQRQRVHRLVDLAVEIPQALRLDLVLQLRHLVGGFVGVVRRDLVVTVDQRLLLGDAFHHVVADVFGRIELRLLRQIAGADAIRRPGFARELLVLPGA